MYSIIYSTAFNYGNSNCSNSNFHPFSSVECKILFCSSRNRDDPDPPSTTRSSYIHHIITLLARPQASTLPPLPKMLWFTFTLQNFSSRISIPCFIIRFHPAYVMCKCVYYVYMCVYIYIVSSV